MQQGASGLPAINDAGISGTLTINGNNATITRGAGAPDFRFFRVAPEGNLTLNDITLTNGALNFGGALYAQADSIVDIDDCIISGNSVTGSGGGIFNLGSITISNSTISGNGAENTGAGIDNRNEADLTITNSTISGNYPASETHALGGAGIYSTDEATVVIRNSTISNNSAFYGGGIFQTVDATMTISNSTISGNIVDYQGGGLGSVGTMTITHSTIANNSAVESGGGIYRASSGTWTLANTLVAANDAPNGPDIFGAIVSNGYNLIGDSSDMTGLVITDLRDGTARPLNLGALGDYGGPTETMALLADSAAINAGNPAFLPTFIPNDQRGIGYPRVVGGQLDIGAFESAPAVLTVQLTLQGRPAAPNAAWETTMHVEVRAPGSDEAVVSEDFASDVNGQFVIPDLTATSYDIWIKGTHTLARLHPVTLVGLSNNLTTATMLEGDADDSNRIVLIDFSLLAASFGFAFGQAGFDARADFNQDKVVNLIDFSLLASNYNQAGAS